uniref:threonine-phosphate decarboxylase n=1 Tax=Pararhizobium sp. IMCC3301 TaxID=3067904 RepID=UPI0027423BC0|nr:threonine-phosphate decarboxylase [Pararhizobium sp. IMCC3301]
MDKSRNADAWLDLSTGINSLAYPLPELNSADWQSLPSARNREGLLETARAYYNVPADTAIGAVPGTEAAINQLPDFLPGPVAIAEPTYSSHRAAWSARGHDVYGHSAGATAVASQHLIIVNPNNPTGELRPAETLLKLAGELSPDCVLIVDEAFMDCTPACSIVPHLRPDLPIIVLKSFGKFFGLAGLRLGFVIGRRDLVEAVSNRFGDWSISGPALRIGKVALEDRAWQAASRIHLKHSMDRLETFLKGPDRILGRTDLFLLYRQTDAVRLHRHLAERQIWTRMFSSQPTWLRFGAPASMSDFSRLAQSLGEFEDFQRDAS